MKVSEKKTLLLVEDEMFIAIDKKDELEEYNYNVLTTTTGEAAVSLCRENGDIDLILMDIDLGRGIDGTEAAEQILKERDLPIVFMSSHTEPEIVEKTEKVNSYGYVVKSSNITVLDSSIKMAFKLFEAHRKVKKNEEKLKELAVVVEQSPDDILRQSKDILEVDPDHISIIGKDFTYKYVNNSYLKAHEKSISQIIGMHVSELLGEQTFETLVKPLLNRCLEGEQIEYEAWFTFIKNKQRFMSVKYLPLKTESGDINSLVVISRDITDRKQAEEQLSIEKNKMENILNAIPDGVYIVSEQFDIEYINPPLKEQFGAINDQKCYKYFHNRTEQCPWCKHSEILEGKSVKWNWYSHKINRYYELFDSPIINADGSISKFEIFHDITDKKLSEEKIKKQLLEKEIILKETHHRIKNNFASITSLLSLQARTENNPLIQAALQDAAGRVDSMKVLYDKLLLTEDYQTTSVKEYLDNLIDDIRSFFPVNLHLVIKKDIDDFQLNSKQLIPIGIIVNEILTNIMKYAFVDKSAGIIEFNLKEHKGNVTISVRDNGIGLPDGFDIEKQKGFGIMLIKMLAQQLNGSFTIVNNNGTKSTLKFSI